MDGTENYSLDGRPLLGSALPEDPLLNDAANLLSPGNNQLPNFRTDEKDGAFSDPMNAELTPLWVEEAAEKQRWENRQWKPLNNSPDYSLNTASNSPTPDIDSLTGTTSNQPLAAEEAISSSSTSPTLSTTSPLPTYSILAEKTVRINGSSDFDGNPTNKSDDAFIYAGAGFTINGQAILPVKRDAAGNPILDSSGRPILIDKALSVASDYREANVSGNNRYSGLLPPQIVDKLSVDVPAYSTIRTQELNRIIPAGTTEVTFRIGSKPLNNATDWNRNFPTPGTATNPKVVRITGGGLNIPDTVDLSNTIVIVESGDINFNKSGHDLNNVTLVTNNGNINLADIQGNKITVLASGSINANRNVRLSGENLLANGGNINFSGATKTTATTDSLRAISQGSITFNSATDTRGYLLSRGDVNFNGSSTLVGSISTKGNITFNGGVTVIGAVERTNNTPTDILLNPNSTAENVPDNTIVGTLSTIDPDVEDTFTYSLVNGEGSTDNNAFTVVGNQLRLNSSPDFEAKNSYGIRIQTTDSKGASFEKALLVSVTNVNEAPTLITLSKSTVAENSASGTIIGLLNTTDPDAGDTFTYSLIDNAGGRFQLIGNQLAVAPGANLDFETNSSHAIAIQAIDKGGLSRTESLIITLTNINEAPTNVTLNPTTIAENVSSDTVVGRFSTTDPDANDSYTYTLVDGEGDTDNAAFTIIGNELRLKSSPDFETKPSYNIRVKATDAAGLSTTKAITVLLNDVNEAPTDIVLNPKELAENVPDNTVVGTLSTTDPDTGDSHTYSLVDGEGDTDNAAFTIIGNELRINNSPDFETKKLYSVRLHSLDKEGLSVEKIVTVNITNVNEAPTLITLSNDTIPEDTPSGTVIGSLTTTDPDANDSHTYTLIDDADGKFALVGDRVRVASGAIFDLENQSSFIIEIGSTDSGGLSATQQFTISLTDINEAPTDISLSANTIEENVPDNTVVGTFNTTDPDIGDSHTIALINGEGDTDNAAFTIDGNQLRISTSPDFETKKSYSLRVQSTDAGSKSVEKILTVSAIDINEAPSAITLTQTSTEENTPSGTVIGILSATDPDAGDSLTYALVNDAEGRFSIDGNQLRVAQGAILDFETTPNLPIVISATDSFGQSTTQAFTITLSDVNEPPTNLVLSNSTIAENVPANSVVGTFSTTDPDADDNYTYALVAGDGDTDNATFSIVGNELRLNDSPDFETKDNYSIRVRATDKNGLKVEKILTLSVTDINDAPTDLAIDNSTIAENVPINTVVGRFSATDADASDNYIYALVAGFGDSDNDSFTIVGNELRVNISPNFEAKENYSLRVSVTDSYGLSVEKVVTVSIADINEAPTAISISANSIDENVPADTVVGTFSTTDPDAGDSYTYALVAGEGDKDNAAFSIVDNQLRIKNSPDFETLSTYKIRIRSTDSGTKSVEQALTINITDLLETPILPLINAALINDTGISNRDGISTDAAIAGTIANAASVTNFKAGFEDGELVDIKDILQSDGSFSLDITRLEQILGQSLTDGTYTLRLQASDSNNSQSNLVLAFTLDTTAPTLNLTTPIDNADHSSTARLIGSVSDNGSGIDEGEYILDDGAETSLNIDTTGKFDQALSQTELTTGTHTTNLEIVDKAGNQIQQTINFSVTPDFVLGPDSTDGWGVKTNDTVLLGERSSYLVQAQIPISLGQPLGSRTLKFDIEPNFDLRDTNNFLSDQLLVYLVDPANPAQTLLDNGTPGTPIFTLAGEEALFRPGLVRFDGTTVEVDLTSLAENTSGLLQFQLLNPDADSGSFVKVSNITNTVDEEGTANPIFPDRELEASIGGALDLSKLRQSNDVEVILSDVRLDSDTGKYTASVQIQNNGNALDRNIAVLFPDLPSGVQLVEGSGTDEGGNPYISMRDAIAPGGLEKGAISDSVSITFDNPNLVRFGIEPQVLVGGANVAPSFQFPDTLTVKPGETLELPLTATDANGDRVTFNIGTDAELPTGKLEGNGKLILTPTPEDIGTYQFDLIATDGVLDATQTVTLNVVADPVTTTRVSGVIQNTDSSPLAGVVIEIGDLQTTTAADGSFTIETAGALPDNAIKVRGNTIEGDKVYPFIAEKLPLLLGKEVYEGYNNVISRPIYLPQLDVANGEFIDPTQDTTVTTPNIPGAEVFVEAGTLNDQQGNPFTGELSITAVPNNLTPASLPENLEPDLVVTIQPGEMVFTQPAPLSLPNLSGYAPGTEMDLWSINPITGQFDKVGKGRVSDDGTVVETIEGGIRNSSWHFFTPPPSPSNPQPPQGPRNPPPGGGPPPGQWPPPGCSPSPPGSPSGFLSGGKAKFNSEAESHSGAVIETHDLVSYQSNGVSRGITLTFDSMRADPRPIVHFGYDNLFSTGANPNIDLSSRLVAKLALEKDGFTYQIPGYASDSSNPINGLDGGENIWSFSPDEIQANGALQADLSSLPSGQYTYSLTSGVRRLSTIQQFLPAQTPGNNFIPSLTGSSITAKAQLLHVNSIDSPFGSGWGIAGWQELVENDDGSILLIDGDGSETVFKAPTTAGEAYISASDDFSTLEKLADGTFRRTMPNQTVYTFNAQTQLTSVKDRQGNETRYVYNSDKRLLKIIDPVGLETTFTYTGKRISKITDPSGRVTQLQYDNAGNLTRITDPDGTSRTWSYDNKRHIISEVNQQGEREQSFYDFAGRATQALLADGSKVQIAPVQTEGLYNSEKTLNPFKAPLAQKISDVAVGSYADGNGNVTATVLDQRGQVISATDGEGVLPSVERNERSLVTDRTDGRGNETNYTYDENGNVTSVTDSILSNTPGAGNLTFSEAKTYTNGSPVFDVGDLNGDSFLDVVAAEISGVSVRLNNGNGEFGRAQTYNLGSNSGNFDLQLEDFNGDNQLDIAIAGGDGLNIALGKGDGSFGTQTTYDLGYTASGLDSGDLDGDGDKDLAVAGPYGLGYGSDDEITIWLNSGDGTFVRETTYPLKDGADWLLEDLNNDEVLDIVAGGGSQSQTLAVRLGNGNGTFGSETITDIGGSSPELVAGDFDEDGSTDIAVADTFNNSLQLLLGNGDGTLTAGENITLSDFSGIAAGDLNGDAHLDLAVTDPNDNTISLLTGKGDGTFELSETQVQTGQDPETVLIEDLNGDDKLDLLTGTRDQSISVNLSGTSRINAERRYTYDPVFSQVTSVTDELGRQTLYDIDPLTGNVLSTTQVMGDVNRTNNTANLSTSSNPLSSVTSFTYTPAGLVDTVTDPEGRVTTREYDSFGKLIKTTYAVGTPDEAFIQYENDAVGNRTALIDEKGNRTEYEYDNLSRLVKITYAVGTTDEAFVQYEYDRVSNLTAFVDENGNRTEYEYDAMDRLVEITEPDPDGSGPLTKQITTRSYDTAGNLVSIIDALGRETKYVYDSRNRAVETIHPDGSVEKWQYDLDDNPVGYTNEAGNQTNRVYDARERLVREIDPQGNATTYEYDASDRLAATIDALGNRTEYEYDDMGRQISIKDALGKVTRTEYDQVDNVVASIDELGRRTEYEYDERDRQIEVTDALGGQASTVYDDTGNIISQTNEEGRTTNYTYDSRDRLISITDPLGGTRSNQYDDANNLLSTTDQLNRTTRYTYDALNRQTKVSDPLGHTTTYNYDAVGNLIATTDALGRTTSYGYDELDRQTSTTNALGDTATTEYDVVGNIIAVTDQIGRTTRFTYDERSLQTSIIDPLGHRTRTDYDAVGNIIAVTDALGQTTQYSYDPLYRQIKSVDPLGQATNFTYDAVGNLLSVTDPENNKTTYTYDELNRQISDTNQLGLTRTYAYDKVGNLTSTTDRNGRTRQFTYDALDRNTAEIWLGVNRTINYTYDAASQLLSVIDPDSKYTYSYDSAGRLIKSDNTGTPRVPNVVLNYTYDAVNNLLSVSDTIDGQAKGVESFIYDELNRVTQITQDGNGVTSKRVEMSYDAASQMSKVTRYNSNSGLVAQSNYVYDEAGRLVNLIHSKGANVLAEYSWVYDAANRIVRQISPDGTSNYSYDATNQLVEANNSNLVDESYSYDSNGNRTNDGYVTGENNQLISDGTYNYEYDGEGNLTKQTEIATGQVTSYEWDYRNRLTEVVVTDSNGNVIKSVQYAYDVFDRRISKSVDADGDGDAPAQVERFVYDGEHIALVFDGNGNQTHRYLHGTQIDQVLADENANGDVNWALTDNQGTVEYVVDSDGNVLNHITYDSFGRVISETNPDVDFRFGYTGREFDEETGLYYYRARYYDPATGRFVGEDAISFAGGDANLYRYVGNSPTNFIDPLGEDAAAVLQGGGNALGQFGNALRQFGSNAVNLGSSLVKGAGTVTLILTNPWGGGVLDNAGNLTSEARELEAIRKAQQNNFDVLPPDVFDPNNINQPSADATPGDLTGDFPGTQFIPPPSQETSPPPFPDRPDDDDAQDQTTPPQSCPAGDLYKPYFEAQRGKQGDMGDTGIRNEALERIRNGTAKDIKEALNQLMKEAKQANDGKGDPALEQRIKREEKAQQIRQNRQTKDRKKKK